MFKPTNKSLREVSRAKRKNDNLPILQMMYNGDETIPLKCLLTDSPGWVDIPCLVTEGYKTRFCIDFNHIRQHCKRTGWAGDSIDKSTNPSELLRSKILREDIHSLFEFMTMMPVSRQYHKYISQDSAIGNITLANYPLKHWPWILREENNYTQFLEKYNITTDVTYDWLIDHLSTIAYPSIHQRLYPQDLINTEITEDKPYASK